MFSFTTSSLISSASYGEMLTSIGLEQLLVLLAESRSFKVEQLSEVQCDLVNRLADIKAIVL